MGLFDFFKKKEVTKVSPNPSPEVKVKITTYNKSDDHLSFSLAGTNFCSDDELERIAELEYAEELVLEPEPTNPYDPNAIIVKTSDNIKIGYIPKDITFELRDPDDNLRKTRCVFTKRSEHEKPFLYVYIKFLD